MSRATEAERFWAKVDFAGAGGCWLWTACCGSGGYGLFSVGSRTNGTERIVRAHRWAYEQLVGPIPEKLVIDHLCRVRECVNPDHLEPVTHAINIRRGVGASATNARKTQCLRGHSFDDPANVGYWRDGRRFCRRCREERERRRRVGATQENRT